MLPNLIYWLNMIKIHASDMSDRKTLPTEIVLTITIESDAVYVRDSSRQR